MFVFFSLRHCPLQGLEAGPCSRGSLRGLVPSMLCCCLPAADVASSDPAGWEGAAVLKWHGPTSTAGGREMQLSCDREERSRLVRGSAAHRRGTGERGLRPAAREQRLVPLEHHSPSAGRWSWSPCWEHVQAALGGGHGGRSARTVD